MRPLDMTLALEFWVGSAPDRKGNARPNPTALDVKKTLEELHGLEEVDVTLT